MDDRTTVGENVDVDRASVAAGWTGAWSGISWGAVIAGAITAIAVSVIIISLGTGIGMVLVSPYSYSSPSAGTMTVIGALWLVFAQAVGFATGGYIAGRLRRPPAALHDNEVQFRDGANGLVVWAIGVVVSSLVLAAAIEKVGSAAGTAVVGLGSASQSPSVAYFTDTLLRPNPQNAASGSAAAGAPATGAAAPSGTSNGAASGEANGGTNGSTQNGAGQRAQINRILLTSLGSNGISSDDRTYLAQLVSAQTGLSQADAQRRVDDVVNRVKEDATQTADAARKAAAYLSFWTFMSLLFGAVCATLGGVLGGDLRDDFAVRNAVPAAPR